MLESVVKVDLSRNNPDLSYDVEIGRDMFHQIAEYLQSTNLGSRYAIITDTNIMMHTPHLNRLTHFLKNANLDYSVFPFKVGEESKNISTWNEISDEIAKAGFGRDSAIIALGGGVTGDLAGFVAATFDRGVDYIQVPTTVLAQADSSVGGKVAVNTPYGKNRRGLIYHPKQVFIDIDTLKTLPPKEYANGLAESVKHAVIGDRDYFHYIRENLHAILGRDLEIFLELAKANCSIKANIVEQDPNEIGKRRSLNYGHTIGHVIEKLSQYKIPHGQAVSMGMMAEARMSAKLEYMPQKEVEMQERLLRDLGLQVNIPSAMTAEQIIRETSGDKKAARGKARYCLPRVMGIMVSFNGEYATEVPEDIVTAAIEETR